MDDEKKQLELTIMRTATWLAYLDATKDGSKPETVETPFETASEETQRDYIDQAKKVLEKSRSKSRKSSRVKPGGKER